MKKILNAVLATTIALGGSYLTAELITPIHAQAATMPILQKGSTGADVKILQNALIARGYTLNPDGIFGTVTRDNVIRFQDKNSLVKDGIVGANTWSALGYGQITSTLGQKAITQAKKYIGNKYSQANRMVAGYKDCSSLVWFSYKVNNINFGSNTTAPNAANIAKFCDSKGFAVSKANLQPGDLIFWSLEKNGRYKNISHVAIYLGNNRMIDATTQYGGVAEHTVFSTAPVGYAHIR